MDELYAKFLPQFVALAHTRLTLAISTAGLRDDAAATKTVRELHTLAGEAGLLGLRDVVPLARECEQKAKQLQTSRAEADVEKLVVALRQLARVIEEVSKA